MNTTDLSATLLAGLLSLEKSGDLVITHPAPAALADSLCSEVIQQWAKQFLDAPPSEIVIDDSIRASSRHLVSSSIKEEEARSIVEKFVASLRAGRTLTEVADLLAHQGPQEIALGAYYCIHMQLGEYYSSEYLEWRKGRHARPAA